MYGQHVRSCWNKISWGFIQTLLFPLFYKSKCFRLTLNHSLLFFIHVQSSATKYVTSPYILLCPIYISVSSSCGITAFPCLPLRLSFLTQSFSCCLFCLAGIQEGTECTKCKNDWVLRAAIALLYVLCALLTIAVAVLGYKGKSSFVNSPLVP